MDYKVKKWLLNAHISRVSGRGPGKSTFVGGCSSDWPPESDLLGAFLASAATSPSPPSVLVKEPGPGWLFSHRQGFWLI